MTRRDKTIIAAVTIVALLAIGWALARRGVVAEAADAGVRLPGHRTMVKQIPSGRFCNAEQVCVDADFASMHAQILLEDGTPGHALELRDGVVDDVDFQARTDGGMVYLRMRDRDTMAIRFVTDDASDWVVFRRTR